MGNSWASSEECGIFASAQKDCCDRMLIHKDAAGAPRMSTGAPGNAPQQQQWPGVEESSPSEEEWRAQKGPTYKAYAFNDAEVAQQLGKAGGQGMLGYRFYRKTTINWSVILLAHACSQSILSHAFMLAEM